MILKNYVNEKITINWLKRSSVIAFYFRSFVHTEYVDVDS